MPNRPGVQISPFLRRIKGGISHFCPACGEMHTLAVEKPQDNGAKWAWNQNVTTPTFHPSVNISHGPDAELKIAAFCCHYWLKNGEIQYLNDCTHALKGVTVRLPPLPDWLRDPCP